MDNKKFEMTEEYKKELELELDNLKNVELDKIKKAVADARDMGDLSENADYSSARDQQAKIVARIEAIEEQLRNAVIVSMITIEVQYKNIPGVKKYYISGSQSDPFAGKISSDSPLAKAVFGHKAGDVVYFTTETGKDVEVKLVSISE